MALINCPECNKEISDKAGACPSCGHPMEKPIVVTPVVAAPNHDLNIKTCPSCKSENTQTVKMACLSGISSGSSTAVGVNTNLDVGIATIGSNSQTSLAAMLNPGSKPENKDGNTRVGCGGIILLSAFIMLIGTTSTSSSDGIVVLFVFFAISAALIIWGMTAKSNPQNYNRALEKYNSKLKYYENGWVCHKCGHTWIS